MILPRRLALDLPRGKSAFLWGARKVGKSSFLRTRFPKSTWFDLLDSDLFMALIRQPSMLRQRIAAELQASTLEQPVIVDEVQKVPALLNEIHWMIENLQVSFVLCGSSARKLKRGHGDLLGGRAWRFEMKPLVYPEIPHFNLLRALNHGLLPSHYLESQAQPSLKAYVFDYLKEEIMAEGLTRNIPAFSRFTDTLGFANGETVNYSNIGRDCGIDSKTVREYFQILVDTLIGFLIEPYSKRPKRDLISRIPKFYLFDPGVANFLAHRTISTEMGTEFGRSFEHLIMLEIRAYSEYSGNDYPIAFWRSKAGHEVDCIVGDAEVALEIKSSSRVDRSEVKGLQAFIDDYAPRMAIVVANEREPRKDGDILILPWKIFLEQLWSGKIFGKN